MALKVTEWDPETWDRDIDWKSLRILSPQFSLVLQASRSRPLSLDRGKQLPFAWRQCVKPRRLVHALFEICTPSPCCLQVDCQGQVSAELNEDTQSPLQEDRAHTPQRPGPGERLLAGAMCAHVTMSLQRLD